MLNLCEDLLNQAGYEDTEIDKLENELKQVLFENNQLNNRHR